MSRISMSVSIWVVACTTDGKNYFGHCEETGLPPEFVGVYARDDLGYPDWITDIKSLDPVVIRTQVGRVAADLALPVTEFDDFTRAILKPPGEQP